MRFHAKDRDGRRGGFVPRCSGAAQETPWSFGEEVRERLVDPGVEAWSKSGWQGWHLSKMQPTSATASA